MADRKALEALFRERGYTEFKWIDSRTIVVSQWVRMKCQYGCDDYGRHACCPPNVPSVADCREFFSEYSAVVVFRFEKQVDSLEERRAWSRSVYEGLLELEREVFLSGYEKAFLLPMSSCSLCPECSGLREECSKPETARPTAEGLAVDVFSTVRRHGFPIEVLSRYDQPMNRYAFLLIE
ncbi:metal-binding protein [candidate division TA06 bacterium SM1_40]|uniref:Metal-binding protein n=1 Tax=candidate division TA06 bacterium SM1_40 TaxID=1703773 RepID=A0A0S8J8H7_UNCT6|nr:MAG: metal-binding protein [candidate division TA06 bacterium SM1_40]